MKSFLFLLSLLLGQYSFAIGGKGPMELQKEGLQNKKSIVLEKVGIDEHLGDAIDLDLPFVDELGNDVTIGKYFRNKPVFLLLIYYECPTLCSLHLNALMDTFKQFEWTIGKEFELVAVSIDPDETPMIASKKLDAYFQDYGRNEGRNGWHFLTGKEENIKQLAKQIGFNYAWDSREQAWAHTAAAYILTPKGVISYYHYGLQILEKVLRLSLVDASEGKIGNIVDRMVLFCMQYDPAKKTYAFYAFNLMRLGGILMVIIFGLFLFKFWYKENKKNIKGNDL